VPDGRIPKRAGIEQKYFQVLRSQGLEPIKEMLSKEDNLS
jgi:hypothetical protein